VDTGFSPCGQFRRSKLQIPQSVYELVATGPLAHLTTINPDGSPEVTVVWVGIDKDNDKDNYNNNDEFVIGHLGLWKKVQNIRRDPRVALSMLGPNTNAQGLRESLVVYGSARITDGGAPILLQRLAHIYVGPDCEFPPPGLPVKPGYITHVAPARMCEIGPWIESGG
jgi:PPOX class probable F420-dependent enzyme